MASSRHRGPNPLRGLRALCAYNTVLDEVVIVSPTVAASLIGTAPLPEEPPADVQGLTAFRAALRWCLSRGEALELLAEAPVLRRLRTLLRLRPRLGGQAAIAASLFARFDAELVVLHPDRLSQRFQRLLTDPRVSVPKRQRGRVELVPAPTALRPIACERHLILELPAGLPAGGGWHSPRATRLILAPHDPVVFDEAFEELLPELREELDLALVAGFNHFGDEWRKGFRRAARQLRSLRTGSVRPLLHLECTAMTDPEKWRTLASEIAPLVDSIGLNEQELATFDGALQGRLPRIARLDDPACVAALRRLRALGPARIHLHTHGATFLTTSQPQKPPLDALQFGVTVGCHAAVSGHIPRPADIRRPWSALGISRAPLWRLTRWGKRQEPCPVFRVETPLVPQPRLTVGLGDLVSLGAVAAEARGRRGR